MASTRQEGHGPDLEVCSTQQAQHAGAATALPPAHLRAVVGVQRVGWVAWQLPGEAQLLQGHACTGGRDDKVARWRALWYSSGSAARQPPKQQDAEWCGSMQ